MLMPDNIHPEQTIYFNGAFVLKTLQENRTLELVELYIKTRTEREMTIPVFLLCLDWLFLLGVVLMNSRGKIELCSSNR